METLWLQNAKEPQNCKLLARDGELGKVKEFYFNDENWTVRYLVEILADG